MRMSLFDSIDLILMNQFTATTSLSLFGGPNHRDVWQKHVPFEAGSNPMLMHGLLAVAALHLAVIKPQEFNTYRMRALHHHSVGLEIFNTYINRLSSENSDALFTFSILLVVWIYAFPATSCDTPTLDDILKLLGLIRGSKIVFLLHRDTILGKPIGRLIETERPPGLPQLPTVVEESFQYLRKEAQDSVCLNAVEDLQRLIKKAIAGLHDTQLVASWPAIVSEEFWARVNRHEPGAVVIFAHYAMLLQYYEHEYWWMSGWSSNILKAVDCTLTDAQKDHLGWDRRSRSIVLHGLERTKLTTYTATPEQG